MKDVLYTDWSMEHPDPVWCDECGAVMSDGEACICDEVVAFYTWTVAEYPVFYCHTCRPDDLGAGGGLITDLAGDVVKCSQCQKELR
jgi:hypothetical protein